MPQGKDSSLSTTVPGIAALIGVPFLLLAWLLAHTAADHLNRYSRMDQVLAGFSTGLTAVKPLETMRDLAASSVYLNAPPVHQKYVAAHAEAGHQLDVFLGNLRAFGTGSLRSSADRLQSAWGNLTIDSNNISNPTIPFGNVERFNDELYRALASLFFVSSMDAGGEINAKELLMLSLDTVRRARREVGTVRSIAIYSTLRDGYLSSADAQSLDSAWSDLHDLVDALREELSSLDPATATQTSLSALDLYLAATEDRLILSQQIGPDWQTEWQQGEQALEALRNISDQLVVTARQRVAAERRAQLRLDVLMAVGLVLMFVSVTALALLFYRSRYAAIRAQAENNAKSLFLARMSHEIRTPLNGVIGLAELLADTQPTPRQQEYIELIGNAGRSLVSLINDILDHAKIEAGKLELEHTPIDIRAIVVESAQVFGLRAGENRTLIFCVTDDDVPRLVPGDPTRIRQILLNLIGNAVKFTEQGRIEIHAALAAGNDGGNRLRIEVRDTGIGLTPAEQQNLFNLFTQASLDVTRRFGGTGLGLSISRELVRLMGGSIGVYSGVGAGSVFWFELPLPADAAPAPERLPELPAPVLLLDADGHLTRALAALPDEVTRRLSTAASVADAVRVLDLDDDLRFVVINGQQNLEDAAVMARELYDLHPRIIVRLLVAVGVDTSPLLDDPAMQVMVRDIAARSVFAPQHLLNLLTPPDSAPATVAETPTRPIRAVLPTGLRVLVAEDNPVNQLVTRGMLAKLGIEADVVADGRQAIERYRELAGGYDIVLMDLDMPVLDGNAATRAIRKLEASCGWRRCPILALSAHAMPEYTVGAREAGMDGQLVKPVTLETLGETLRAHYRPRPPA